MEFKHGHILQSIETFGWKENLGNLRFGKQEDAPPPPNLQKGDGVGSCPESYLALVELVTGLVPRSSELFKSRHILEAESKIKHHSLYLKDERIGEIEKTPRVLAGVVRWIVVPFIEMRNAA